MTPLPYRELYAPGHFGNSYEVMAPYEMKEVLREAKWWGFNSYCDWLDAADLKEPHFNPRHEYLLPQAIWERKLEFYRIAHNLGLETNLLTTPNHVYLNQHLEHLKAHMDDERFFGGQLVCPSIPEARDMILENHRLLFADLKEKGVELASITGGPFDYGGCSCDRCSPWILTFARLFSDLHDLARSFFPDIRARLIGWWWTKDEHRLFTQWANGQDERRFVSNALHLKYDATSPEPDITLPEGCSPHCFVHMGYPDMSGSNDLYGAWGPMVAPKRLPETIENMMSDSYGGFSAYSEGICDDVNKAVLAGIASGQYEDVQSVLMAYAERYFDACSETVQQGWAEWLAGWGNPLAVDLSAARSEFDELSDKAEHGWRLGQWEAKLRMFEAHRDVLIEREWNEARKSAAERFILERDRLYREIWRLGLVRHALNPRYRQPEWYSEYVGADTGLQTASEA